ncbi:MAG TPA: VOC family protein [Blastocatellia bacterium]|nr:VOC family protein [Blastocatellia bacterium]
MNLINGIGGAFIFSNHPKRLADWYTEMLGMKFEGSDEHGAYYQVFWALDPADPARKLDTSFSIIRSKTPFGSPPPEVEPESMYGDQPFMLNLRTHDLDALADHLARGGARVIKRQDEPYGKFAWVRDPDGNRVELYQPVEHDGEEQ